MPEQTQKSTNPAADSAKMQGGEKPAREREIEILERKLLAAKALIDEGLSRLKELKTA